MSSKKRTTPEAKAKHQVAKRRRHKARMATDPVYRKRQNRKKTLSAYGISPADYAVLQVSQDNQCGICGLEPMPEDRALAVDCDHGMDPPFVRGLLCMPCNTAIGKLKHDPRLLQRAIDWLQGVR